MSYQAFNSNTLKDYLTGLPQISAHLGGLHDDWKIHEVGDGNLNLIFIVQGPTGSYAVKQALPYVRLVGESWPLPFTRAWFEHEYLSIQSAFIGEKLPQVHHFDKNNALIVMDYLSPHVVLRNGLIDGKIYPQVGKDLGNFLAKSLVMTSDFYASSITKKSWNIYFSGNIDLCKITEDLVFTESFFNAPMNHHTSPQLDDIAIDFQKDEALILAVQQLKYVFMTHGEALIHGDLHTGSVMVTPEDTKIIDAEFACIGPMGFDIGALIANFLMSYISQAHHRAEKDRTAYQAWIAETIKELWQEFVQESARLLKNKNRDGAILPSTIQLSDAALDQFISDWQANIFKDTMGFSGVKMIRRILGLAHVRDFESIEDKDVRAKLERQALLLGRAIILNPPSSIDQLLSQLKA